MPDPQDYSSTAKIAGNPELLNAFCEFIQAFGGTIINIKRYPEGSATVGMALERCRTSAEQVYRTLESFTISESERRILVDNEPLGEKIQERAYIRTFVDSMVARGIRSISFHKAMTQQELTSFLRVMGEKPEDLRKSGPMDVQLREAGVRNIVIDEKVFVALVKGQTVADIADLEKVELLGKGQLEGQQVNDGLFLSYLLSRIPVDSLNIPANGLEALKEKIGFDSARKADNLDFQKIGAVITAALEDWSGAEKAAGGPGDNAPGASDPDDDGASGKATAGFRSAHDEQVNKIVRSFEEISNSIVRFQQPAVRAKLLNDFLKVVLNFKELTLAKILTSQMEANDEVDLKSQIIQNISTKKRSAVIDLLLEKYQRVVDGLRVDDFQFDTRELSESENVLKRILVLAKRQEQTEIAEKAQRAIGMARLITKETSVPGGIIILKMKRLFSRPPEYMTQNEFLSDFGELAKVLSDAGRADLIRKILDRLALNFQSEEQALRLATVQAVVRIHQQFLAMGRSDLLSEGYLVLTKQIKLEKEMVVFAHILAAIVSDYQKVLETKDFGLAGNILRLLIRLRDESEGTAQRQIFEQAVNKLTSADNLTDSLFEAIQSEDEREAEAATRLLTVFPKGPVLDRVLDILLKSEDRRVRKKCLVFVGRLGPSAREAVTTRLSGSYPWYFQRNMIGLVAEVGDESSVTSLRPFLVNTDDRLRRAAVAALTRIGGLAANQALADHFDTQPAEIQGSLIQHFTKEKSNLIVASLIGRLQDKAFVEANEASALTMIQALGEIGDRSATETLASYLKRGGGLMGMFSKTNENVLAACISALGRLGDRRSAESITRYSNHSNPAVAKAAQESIRRLQSETT